MIKNLKRSTVERIKVVLFALCALSWLRIVMSILCAAASVFFLVQYFKTRKEEK